MAAFQRFQSRTVIVAGSDGILERAVTTAFREEGANVLSIATETPETDLEFPDRIDVLVLIPPTGKTETIFSGLTPGDWRHSVTEPLERFFSISQRVVSAMLRQSGGTVLCVCSAAARDGSGADPMNSVLHAAVRQWVRCLAVQAAPNHVRCNTIFYDGIDVLPRTGAVTAAGRIEMQTPYLPWPGTVEDVAQAALFLADPDSGFCVGAELSVDGGLCAGTDAYSGHCSIGNAILENMLQDGVGPTSSAKIFDPSAIDFSEFEEPTEPQTILVTGVSKGLGRALVDKLIVKGHVVLGCARSEKAMDKLRSRYGGSDKPHRFAAIDAADRAAVLAWAEALKNEGIVPDFLFNNAAIIGDEEAPVWKHTAENFERVVRVNVMSTVNVIHAFVPSMLRRMKGVVVNFSSGWGREAAPRVGPYAVSKWGVEGLSRVLAAELPSRMCCVSLHPGIVRTESMTRGFGTSAGLYPSPEQWADVAVPFLLSLKPKDNGKALSVPGMTEFRGMGTNLNVRLERQT